MFTSQQIYRTLREAAFALNHDLDIELIQNVEQYSRNYALDEFAEFKRDLVEAGNKIRMLFMENAIDSQSFSEFTKESSTPTLVFIQGEQIHPCILSFQKNNFQLIEISDTTTKNQVTKLEDLNLLKNDKGEIIFFALFNYESPLGTAEEGHELSPVRRLMQLLRTERKEIFYIFFFAVVVGFISLILPLGIQTTVELVSGGVIFSSVYVMIGLVIVGVILSGGLQIVQISLVEFLQRRIFTKAAFEFAFRIPRIQLEALHKNYAPELVNRFFDVMTIQKGLPKLLIDLSSAVIQILFGLLLISLYHPFFVFFGLILVTVLVLIFYSTGSRGLKSSISESKYKYKVAHWFEELARAIQSFKLAGNTELPLRKTDHHVNNYLKNRKIHFDTLVLQFGFIVVFKAAIVGGLLIMGTMLVVNKQITLGQFVAAEVIIILILNAVEKIIMYMDVVYDLLTAVDKVGHVTDLKLEKSGGLDFSKIPERGFSVSLKNLKYKFEDQPGYALDGIDLEIQAGEKICISGPSGAGKTTLTNIITGLYTQFEGIATINNYSLRDLDLTHLHDFVAKNISAEDLFDGTLLENITVGKTSITAERVIQALDQVGVLDKVNQLPQGLDTHLLSTGKGLTETFAHQLIVARCLAEQPKLLVLNDFFYSMTKANKLDLLNRIINSC
ncbi:MAG TPA: xenobiotic-transporting ATPase, partial [Cytophagales bacterium]|nr:xenobiotic-transporting ATPase [Cytophagales bacterium]